MEVYETTVFETPAQINQSFCFLFCACRTRCHCGSDSAFQSATESRCFWWLRQRMKFPRPQMARSASAYWVAVRERRFSTKSGSHVKNLGAHWNIRHHWVQLVPISCSLARNTPLRSFVVLCGPLRYLVIPHVIGPSFLPVPYMHNLTFVNIKYHLPFLCPQN